VDAGAAAPKDGPREWPYGERCGGVVAFLFCHMDGMKRTVGHPGVRSASSLAAPRSWFGELTREQWATEFLGAMRGFFFHTKAQRLGANSGDTCVSCYPLWGVIVVIISALSLLVKTIDLHGLDGDGAECVVTLFRGFVVELRLYLVFCFVFGG
jgi:hypothetical protein